MCVGGDESRTHISDILFIYFYGPTQQKYIFLFIYLTPALIRDLFTYQNPLGRFLGIKGSNCADPCTIGKLKY